MSKILKVIKGQPVLPFNNPTVVVMRGVPGSGKSTFIKENFGNAVVVSNDHFFTSPAGEYKFDVNKIAEANRVTWRRFLEATERTTQGQPTTRSNNLDYPYSKEPRLIVVDNTNCSTAEIGAYMLPAQARGFDAFIFDIRCDVRKAAERNVHGLTFEQVERFARTIDQNDSVMPWFWEHYIIDDREFRDHEFKVTGRPSLSDYRPQGAKETTKVIEVNVACRFCWFVTKVLFRADSDAVTYLDSSYIGNNPIDAKKLEVVLYQYSPDSHRCVKKGL